MGRRLSRAEFGSGTWNEKRGFRLADAITQYDVNGKVVPTIANFTYAAVRFSA